MLEEIEYSARRVKVSLSRHWATSLTSGGGERRAIMWACFFFRCQALMWPLHAWLSGCAKEAMIFQKVSSGAVLPQGCAISN